MKTVNGWLTWKLEECCDILDNKRIPVNSGDREKRIGDIPYYGANGLQGYIDDFIFDEPLILIAEDGGHFDDFSTKPIAYRIEGKSWVNNHAHVLRSKVGFSQDAIFYGLEHKDIQPFIVGGTRAKLNQSALRSITIELPEKESEQSKIAEILSTVDRAIEQTENLNTKQQRIKTGLMQDLLTRGIDEQGNLRSEETHEFKDSPLGRIPVEWEVSPAHSLCSAVVDCKNRTPALRSDGYPVIRTPNVRDGRFIYGNLTFTNKKSYEIWTARGKPRVGDVIITREAPFGEACLIPHDICNACLGQRMMMYQTDPSLLDHKYLVYTIYSERIQKRLFELAGGSTVGHIRVGDIRNLPIAHPLNVEEQLKISNILSGVDLLLEQSRKELIKYSALKKGLMQDLITGKVRVTPLLEDKYGC
jgi:type I restriction enzyme S subunit